MQTKPNVLILRTEGTNCDEELAFAFAQAGGNPQFVHVNDLREKRKRLKDFNILALPGGFSYGDDVVSGKILAVELTSFFEEELKKFVGRKDTLTIGVCNGFQVLVRTGLLPFNTPENMQATLVNNDSGHFECRWIKLRINDKNNSPFLKDLGNTIVTYQVAHGEGKFFAPKKTLAAIGKKHLVALQYIDEKGNPTQQYPENPNGALHAIAGITDETGRIFGLMPHPERFVLKQQYPNWRRETLRQAQGKPHGLPIFENAIEFCKYI
ncbi:MAG: phosphoribosylformylglycinamidine synthase I [Candidatus Levybacteria bacterium]|nr:phosphoribosylformylglycinamidine synthase I [Candidatus Levybacteria bacterium]